MHTMKASLMFALLPLALLLHVVTGGGIHHQQVNADGTVVDDEEFEIGTQVSYVFDERSFPDAKPGLQFGQISEYDSQTSMYTVEWDDGRIDHHAAMNIGFLVQHAVLEQHNNNNAQLHPDEEYYQERRDFEGGGEQEFETGTDVSFLFTREEFPEVPPGYQFGKIVEYVTEEHLYLIEWDDGRTTSHYGEDVWSLVDTAEYRKRCDLGPMLTHFHYSQPTIPEDDPRIEEDEDTTTKDKPKCERIDASSMSPDELYHEYFVKSKPVVLEGAWKSWVDDTEFMAGWTLDGLAQRWGNNTIIALFHHDNQFQRIRHFPGEGLKYVFPDKVPMDFSQFKPDFKEQERLMKSKIQKGDDTPLAEYLNFQALELYHAEKGWINLAEPISLPSSPLENITDLSFLNIWVTGRKKISRLHNDQEDNILGQLSGTKTVYLVDPANQENLYIGSYPNMNYVRLSPGEFDLETIPGPPVRHFVPIDILNPDYDMFPAFKTVMEANQVMECTINPGDLLFIPATWWHQVHSDTPEGSYDADLDEIGTNVAINFWFKSNKRLTQYYDMALTQLATDWVGQGKSCDKLFTDGAAERKALREENIGY